MSYYRWGVFELDQNIHVVPCDESGVNIKEHELTLECACQPDILFGVTKDILVHHEIH